MVDGLRHEGFGDVPRVPQDDLQQGSENLLSSSFSFSFSPSSSFTSLPPSSISSPSPFSTSCPPVGRSEEKIQRSPACSSAGTSVPSFLAHCNRYIAEEANMRSLGAALTRHLLRYCTC
eukprot:758968-Hanusia_phi.AAC.6